MKSDIFKYELQNIKSEDIRKCCIKVLENAPDYFWYIAASSTGKYHCKESLGLGGLVRHTLIASKFLEWILSLEQYKSQLTDRECDCLRCAILIHDNDKLGYSPNSSFSVLEHPLLSSQRMCVVASEILPQVDVDYIASACASHMGEWNTSTRAVGIVLPKPVTLGEQLVHLADYLSSKKDLSHTFNEEITSLIELNYPTKESYMFTFGKYKGIYYSDVEHNDISYLNWLSQQNVTTEPLATFLSRG